MPFKFNPDGKGLGKWLYDYQILAYGRVSNKGDEGAVSNEVYKLVNEELDKGTYSTDSISRASIINSLNLMVDEGILNYIEETCKGGIRRRYFSEMNEDELKRYLIITLFESLYRDWPGPTMEALKESIKELGIEL